jgi:hypothetical protein
MSEQPRRRMAPFEFRSDFAPPPETPTEPEALRVTVQELAFLLEDARRQGVELAAEAREIEAREAVAGLQDRLQSAMDDLVALTRYVEAAADRAGGDLSREVGKASSRIVDGQGELFPGQAKSLR